MGPGRITLGAHFGRVDGDPQSARGPLLKTTPIVSLIFMNSLYFCNSADRTLTSALFLVIDNIEGGYWYNCYIKTTYPSAVLLIDICLES